MSPTLGHAALVAGLAAGLAGLFLVMLYVILYYRLLGLVVVLGLAVTAALLWSIISALGPDLGGSELRPRGHDWLDRLDRHHRRQLHRVLRTIEGRDEIRQIGADIARPGFASAWRTVVAADTVSLLAAVLLYFLAVGDVKGFAFFLGLSTILDIFVTWFFTRPPSSCSAGTSR